MSNTGMQSWLLLSSPSSQQHQHVSHGCCYHHHHHSSISMRPMAVVVIIIITAASACVPWQLLSSSSSQQHQHVSHGCCCHHHHHSSISMCPMAGLKRHCWLQSRPVGAVLCWLNRGIEYLEFLLNSHGTIISKKKTLYCCVQIGLVVVQAVNRSNGSGLRAYRAILFIKDPFRHLLLVLGAEWTGCRAGWWSWRVPLSPEARQAQSGGAAQLRAEFRALHCG